MAKHRITQADIKQWAKNYKGELFDGILCDPPYELGFMGKSWDSSGIAFDVEMWQDIYKLLKPGGHLLAFSGSRTYHRMAVAIEDAGFEIRDQLIWMYGSGFPKSLNIGKAVDKIQGNEREVIRHKPRPITSGTMSGKSDTRPWIAESREKGYHEVAGNIPVGDDAKHWNGYGTALKPAHEPCVLARKPIEGTVANNVLKHGTGGLNIDGTRIQTTENLNGGGYNMNGTSVKDLSEATSYATKVMEKEFIQPTGRFPANLIHDGSDEVGAVFPQTGKSSGGRIGNKGSMINTMGNAFEKGDPGFGDSGSASRYFYCAKASKSERNAGLEGFEEKDVSTLQQRASSFKGKKFGGIRQNHHPTVKPLSLTKYLATLIKPPTGGRLLVPFSGSGSEMIGALQAGWEYVEGVELTEEYIPIAEARIKYWLSQVEEGDKQGTLL